MVQNILACHGPVFNVGERVEAYSVPLWVLILTIVRGLVPNVSIEWWAVGLGLVLTALGVAMAFLATTRIGSPHSLGVVVPLGALIVAPVDAMWDFTTSGLEDGLIFSWIAMSWWLVERHLRRRRRVVLSAMVIGLGPVIRPDMLLIALGLLVALLLANPVMVGDLANGRIRLFRAVGAFVLLPLLSGVFRVVYFGLLAPNTALAKSAFSPHLIQGSRYLKDFLLPNALWVPAIVSFIILALRLDSWWRRGVRAEVLMISAWALGALADGGYVLWIGGDFMHARMLLPAFFCLAMLVWIDLGNRVERTFPLAILLVWALISGGILRYTQPGIGPDGIANERSYYLAQAQAAHPVDRIDFSQFVGYQQGVLDRRVARSLSAPHGQLIALDVLTSRDVRQMVATRGTRRILAHSHLSERLFIPAYSIGIWGVAAGPDVYLFDQLNLADPVGSHFSDVRYGRPGHSDIISSSWMLARFGTVSDHRFLGESGAALVASERRVMACQPLFGLLGYHHGSLLVGRRPAQPRARGHVDDDAVPVDTEGRLHPALSMTAPHE